MNLRDIIYLDSGRLTSLLSQLQGGVAEHGSEAETDASRDRRTVRSAASGHDEKELGTTVSQQVERVREVRYFDHLLTLLLDEVSDNIVMLDAEHLRERGERAFRAGALVQVSGPLFLDDFGAIGGSLSASPKYFDTYGLFAGASERAKLEALNALKATGREHSQLEAEKQKARSAIKASEAHLNSLKETFASLGAAVEAFFGDAVECGVMLDDGQRRAIVRALLERAWLREPMSSLTARYGTRTAATFTIIGTVTKTSWIAPPTLSEEERTMTAGLRSPPTAAPHIEAKSLRAAVLSGQAMFENVRELVMTVGDGDSVSIAPLTVFRRLDFATKKRSQ